MMTKQISFDFLTGKVSTNFEVYGLAKKNSATDGTINLGNDKFLFFFVPFSQGYELELYRGSEKVADLGYMRGEGFTINTPNLTDVLDFQNGVLTLRSTRIGRAQVLTGSISAEVDESALKFDVLETLLLMVLDSMWANRVGFFPRPTQAPNP